MNENEQRIAIAKTMGAYVTMTRQGQGFPVNLLVMPGYVPPESWDDAPGMEAKNKVPLIHHGVPNYLRSLDAMHKAEKALMERSLWVDYTDHLGMNSIAPDRRIMHATAAQRAEAFLRTLNLWKE